MHALLFLPFYFGVDFLQCTLGNIAFGDCACLFRQWSAIENIY